MESLFIVNPRRKKRKGKMPAGLRRYWAARKRQKNPRRKRRRASAVVAAPARRRSRRRNPVSSRKRRRGKRAGSVVSYSRRKRRVNPKYMRRARRRNPMRRRRRNPIEDMVSTRSVLAPAAIGALAAIGTQIVFGAISPNIPGQFTGGPFPFLFQAVIAVLAGVVVGKVMGERDGQIATAGALTVAGVTAITPFIQSAFPQVPGLAGLANVNRLGAYQPRIGAMPGRRMGAYASSLQRNKTTRFGRLGFVSPAPKLGAYMGRAVGSAAPGDLSGSGFNGLNG
jgi:hypothetical protein